MRNIKNKMFALIASFIVLAMPLVAPLNVSAQTTPSVSTENLTLICQLFPFIATINTFRVNSICQPAGSVESKDTIANTALDTVRAIASLIFVAIVVIAVYIIIKAAIKYIRSEGDETKIQEAQKAIKSVFVGLIALFIGVIGLVIILVIFDAVAAVNTQPQVNLDSDL